jgi:hypothetical protein
MEAMFPMIGSNASDGWNLYFKWAETKRACQKELARPLFLVLIK